MTTPDTRQTWRDRVAERGLTLRGVAIATGTSVRSVYAYAQGTRNPSDEWLGKVEELLGRLERAA